MNINKIINKYDAYMNNSRKHSAIQMLDNERVIIECCKKIKKFDENEIKISLARCNITVVGLELRMKNFSRCGVEISGNIHSISFENSNGKEEN